MPVSEHARLMGLIAGDDYFTSTCVATFLPSRSS